MSAASLSSECNLPKQNYDTCFNHWFQSYLILVSPPLINPAQSKEGIIEREKRELEIKSKKVEYEKNCGGFYSEYMGCLKKAIGGRDGLSELLQSARAEEPIESWAGIKVATEEDLKG